ncbi:MAG: DUF1254 domain-containing protein [Planctomycetaceae bacterium]|nr:DUF1254 domain-containing protein [Planctomycetaceae bacterium]
MTDVPAGEALRGPVNNFINVKRYPPADYRGVSAPNADTLYSVACLDLGKEPIVFTYPDMGKRNFLFPMYSMQMNVVQSLGSRTTGGKAGKFLVTGPGWNGEVRVGMKQVKSPSKYMLILGRTYADGTEQDYEIVNGLQAQYKLTPLSEWGKDDTYKAPPVDPNPVFSMTYELQKVILDMGTEGYFNMMADLLGSDAPPAEADAPILARMAKIGIVPDQQFELSSLDPAVQAAMKDVPEVALKKIEANKPSLGVLVDGWVITKGLGDYGTDYMKRAVVAAFGWGANLQEDAVYPNTEVDSNGETLTGANKCTLMFAKGQAPPVNGFWSLTMYEIDKGWWFVPNELNKFTVSPRNNLKYADDGSLTLYLQNQSPGTGKEANWSPARKDAFVPMLRIYWPKATPPSIIDGTRKVPAVEKVS